MTEDAARTDADHSAGHELLTDVQELLSWMQSNFLTTESLIANLVALPDSRWHEEGLTGRRLAILLRSYGISVGRNPSTQKRERGYLRADFVDVFERYLDDPDNGDRPEPSEPSTSG